jgi:hypothetical protein
MAGSFFVQTITESKGREIIVPSLPAMRQQHRGVIRRAASTRIGFLQGADVETLDDFDNKPGPGGLPAAIRRRTAEAGTPHGGQSDGSGSFFGSLSRAMGKFALSHYRISTR